MWHSHEGTKRAFSFFRDFSEESRRMDMSKEIGRPETVMNINCRSLERRENRGYGDILDGSSVSSGKMVSFTLRLTNWL